MKLTWIVKYKTFKTPFHCFLYLYYISYDYISFIVFHVVCVSFTSGSRIRSSSSTALIFTCLLEPARQHV